jgi:ribose 5-phosphate isomerase RpiB
MKIGIIQASSQADKNGMIVRAVQRYAAGAEIINFGCRTGDSGIYSYVEISLLAGLLLTSGAVDFIVTGCSSGQGMMLACNSFPGVLCGYIPTPADAWLFAQINNGNAISLPLGEEYTWAGYENCAATLARLFSEPFGQGYPRAEAERKLKDTLLLKQIRAAGQVSAAALLESLDRPLAEKLLRKRNVIDYILRHGKGETVRWIRNQEEAP